MKGMALEADSDFTLRRHILLFSFVKLKRSISLPSLVPLTASYAEILLIQRYRLKVKLLYMIHLYIFLLFL